MSNMSNMSNLKEDNSWNSNRPKDSQDIADGLLENTEIQGEAPKTSQVAVTKLADNSLEIEPDRVCNPVAAKYFSYFLSLAERLKFQRERQKHSQRLREELGVNRVLAGDLQQSGVDGAPAIVEQRVILDQLNRRGITVEEWQQVTQSAGVSELLMEARSLEARELGLPEDATEEQIKKKAQVKRHNQILEKNLDRELSRQNLCDIALQAIKDIRDDPGAHTSARAKDGSVKLKSVDIHLETGPTWAPPEALAKLMVAGTVAISASAGAATVWSICRCEAPLEIKAIYSFIFGAFASGLGGLAGGGLILLAQSFLFWPLANRKFLATITSSLPMQKAIRDLEAIGVKCDAYLDQNRLVIRLYLPGNGRNIS
jgi:hypothetical protein